MDVAKAVLEEVYGDTILTQEPRKISKRPKFTPKQL